MIHLSQPSGRFQLNFEDSHQHRDVWLDQTYAAWTMIAIVREAGILKVYENGTITNTVSLSSPNTSYGGTVTFHVGGATVWDTRILPRAVSAEALLYLYQDVTQHNGDSTYDIW